MGVISEDEIEEVVWLKRSGSISGKHKKVCESVTETV